MTNQTKGEKGVPRRVWGGICLLIGCSMGFLGGFTFYSPDVMITGTIIAAGLGLLGVGNVTDIWKK
jgi:hypothetical protein